MPARRLFMCLARLVLAWFVLHVGAGIAAPLVQPHAYELVCAGGTLKLLEADGEEGAQPSTMECPLCSPALAPPPARQPVAATNAAVLLPPLRSAALPPPAHAPPLARGPPVHA